MTAWQADSGQENVIISVAYRCRINVQKLAGISLYVRRRGWCFRRGGFTVAFIPYAAIFSVKLSVFLRGEHYYTRSIAQLPIT